VVAVVMISFSFFSDWSSSRGFLHFVVKFVRRLELFAQLLLDKFRHQTSHRTTRLRHLRAPAVNSRRSTCPPAVMKTVSSVGSSLRFMRAICNSYS